MLQKWILKSESRKSLLIPKLRFSEFRNTKEWEPKLLSDCLDCIQPDRYLVEGTIHDNGYKTPVLSTGSTFILGYTNESHGVFSENLPVILFDDLTASMKFVDFPFKLKSSATKILQARENINIKFIYDLMQTIEHEEAGAWQRHWTPIFLKLKTAVPELKEQQKIVDCLTTLDELISLQSQKAESLKTYKMGLMQLLFPAEREVMPKLRFPEFQDAGKWTKKKLGEVAEIVNGGTPAPGNSNYWGGDINWFTPKEINSKYSSASIRKITKEGLEESSATLLPAGTILFTSRETIGKVSIAREECSTNEDFQSIKIESSSLVNEYVYYWILQNQNLFLRKADGIMLLRIEGHEMKKIPLCVPPLEEQQKIADCLSSIDELITIQFQKLKTLELYKKGLSQQIFFSIHGCLYE